MSDQGTGNAFGKPGIPPRWTSSSKEGVGTAYSTASKVWFTLSHGILNEIYYPTIDRPQIRDLQFLISDGESFFHEEKRDLDSEIHSLERDTLGYRVVSTDPAGRYRISKEIVADPHQSCVLVHARVEADPAWLPRLRLYALLAPHLEVGGWGNFGRSLRVNGSNILIAWKERTYLAMGASTGFSRTSCGYVGFSDGWQDLRQHLRMEWQFERAENGNIALTGQIDLSRGPEFTLGVAFGDGQHSAVTTLEQSLSRRFGENRQRYIEQWSRVRYDVDCLAKSSGDQGYLSRLSRNLLLAHEDKSFAGALIASASIPWGQAKGDEDLGGYHLVWTRDMVHSTTGLMACGDLSTALRALVYLACSQQPDGGFPQNFWLDGTAYWQAIQLDEVAFPILLAWRLWKSDGLGEFDPWPMVKAAARFLIHQGPMTQQERWEECSGYSPSTLAATIAALICAADFATARGQAQAAAFLQDIADFLEAHVETWTVTTQGTLLPGISRHYIRIDPTDVDDPSPDEDPNLGVVAIANRPPGAQFRFPARDVVDAGFLELVRYGIRKPADPLMEDSLRVVDAVLRVESPYGPCWRRYNHDGYGPRPDGGPYEGWGRGRAWPLLTGERGHYELAAGRDPRPYILAMERFASKGGMLPEQIWDQPDLPSAGMFLGRPAGSAMPLMWAHSEYVKLLRSAAAGRVVDLIPIVADRYLAQRGRKDLEVWKARRQVRSISAGQTLRVLAPQAFRLHWSADEWQSVQQTASTPSGLGAEFADLAVNPAQKAPLRFTFYWTADGLWEGRDYTVAVRPAAVGAAAVPDTHSRGNRGRA